MHTAVWFIFVSLLAADSSRPEETIRRAHQLYDSGDVLAAERALAGMIEGSQAAGYSAYQLATAHANLGVIHQDMARAADAERSYLRARALLEQDETDPAARALWLRTTINLASMYLETGQAGKAERIVEILRKAEVPEGDDAVRVQGMIASLHMVRGQGREAEELFLNLLKHWERRGNAKESAVLLNNLGVLAMDRNDPATAASRLRRSLDLWKQSVGVDHPASLTAMANYGCALLMTGKRVEAAELLERALSAAREWRGDAAPISVHLARLYSSALDATGRSREARQIRAEAERLSKALAATDPAVHTVDVLDLAPRPKGRNR